MYSSLLYEHTLIYQSISPLVTIDIWLFPVFCYYKQGHYEHSSISSLVHMSSARGTITLSLVCTNAVGLNFDFVSSNFARCSH